MTETAERLREMLEVSRCRVDESGTIVTIPDEECKQEWHLRPPLLQPIPGGASARDFLDLLEAGPRRQLLILIQAGASALGYWLGSELLAHKAIKKYVVRGQGKAQPAHLKTKGKSRYGSRLRLRNATAQFVQTNEKLREWVDEYGPADDVFISCPKRSWPVLFESTPPPPFSREEALRIPIDVRVPDFRELRNVHRKMSRGRSWRTSDE